jgi:hypothetical protein
MVPGFEFLQGLFKNAGAGLPHIGQWVAPTLDPEELEKRIQELKTVQFWLEQNAKAAGHHDPGAGGAAHDPQHAADHEPAAGRSAVRR